MVAPGQSYGIRKQNDSLGPLRFQKPGKVVFEQDNQNSNTKQSEDDYVFSLHGGGAKNLECNQDAPSRIRSRPLV
jgi:hypothetical protein